MLGLLYRKSETAEIVKKLIAASSDFKEASKVERASRPFCPSQG